ncbi:MAG: ribosome biogenesis protein [Thermoplasmata archaeon HGW-Thermoplasmata-2]|nr:MAG: ribosome biogenesis protein [Thermoplasmata archaeon HGW-Thermoplasmata-2]
MKTLFRRCDKCSLYTFGEKCPKCSAETRVPIPPRFSPEDKYGKYRRMLKKEFGESAE